MSWLFIGSLLAILTVFAWKRYEITQGNGYLFLQDTRKGLDAGVVQALQLIQGVVLSVLSGFNRGVSGWVQTAGSMIASALRRTADFLDRS